MLVYKRDVLKELSDRGYSSYRLRNEKILSEVSMQKIRTGNTDLSTKTLNVICLLLRCQLSDIVEVIPTDEEKIRFF